MRVCVLNGLLIFFKPADNYRGKIIISYKNVEYDSELWYKNFGTKLSKNEKTWDKAVLEMYTEKYLEFKDIFERKIEVGGAVVDLEIEYILKSTTIKHKKNEGNTRREGSYLISGDDY